MRAALHAGDVDAVIHFLDDLPVEPAEGLQYVAVVAAQARVAGRDGDGACEPCEGRVRVAALEFEQAEDGAVPGESVV